LAAKRLRVCCSWRVSAIMMVIYRTEPSPAQAGLWRFFQPLPPGGQALNRIHAVHREGRDVREVETVGYEYNTEPFDRMALGFRHAEG